MLKKNITIEDLAIITKKGFDEMGENFKGVEERLERIELRFSGDGVRPQKERLKYGLNKGKLGENPNLAQF